MNSVNTQERNKLSRRDFLKLAGLGLIELVFGPANKALEWIGNGQEVGNTFQRAAKLESLTRSVILNPTAINQEILGSFLKFNAAEMELNHQGYPLAADLMKTFIYGDGSPKDISHEYENLITQAAIFPYRIFGSYQYPESLTKRFQTENKPFFSEQGLSSYFSVIFLNAFEANHMSTGEKSLGRVKIHQPKDEYKHSINNNGPISFTQTVSTPDGPYDSAFNSLHNYAVTASGNVLSKRRIQSNADITFEDVNFNIFSAPNIPDKWLKRYFPHTRLQLDCPRIQVADIYDFSRNVDFMTKLGHQATAADAFRFLSDIVLTQEKTVELWNQLPPGIRDYLGNLQLMELKHHRAATLQTQQGIAHTFPISANLELYAPLTVPLFDRDLDFEP